MTAVMESHTLLISAVGDLADSLGLAPPAQPRALPITVVDVLHSSLSALRNTLFQLSSAGSLNEQQLSITGQVVAQINQLTLLLNDLAQIEQLRHAPTSGYEPVMLETLLEAALATQRSEFERREHQLSIYLQHPSVPVLGDRSQLGRVVLELLANAAQFSPAGAHITIVTTRRRDRMQIAVQNRPGTLTHAELERIFEPLFRAPSTAHFRVAGRGLGLTFARAVVERHGGQLWAAKPQADATLLVCELPVKPA
jgi:signal transduction histidine kinase